MKEQIKLTDEQIIEFGFKKIKRSQNVEPLENFKYDEKLNELLLKFEDNFRKVKMVSRYQELKDLLFREANVYLSEFSKETLVQHKELAHKELNDILDKIMSNNHYSASFLMVDQEVNKIKPVLLGETLEETILKTIKVHLSNKLYGLVLSYIN